MNYKITYALKLALGISLSILFGFLLGRKFPENDIRMLEAALERANSHIDNANSIRLWATKRYIELESAHLKLKEKYVEMLNNKIEGK